MITYNATIKEVGNDHLLTPSYTCTEKVDEKFLVGFWGLDCDDVEWYKIELVNE